MKASFYFALFLLSHSQAFFSYGQVAERLFNSAPMFAGPHEQQIPYTQVVNDSLGNEIVSTNSYTQLATGLNRWDEQSRSYVPASAEIEMIDGKGVIRQTQHKVILAQNANDPNGLLDLLAPSGDRLVTQPIGIALTEADTGKSVFLAELKASEAVLLDSQTLVYPDAFDQFKAAIVVQSRLSGIESDVVLQEKIDRTLIEQFGMNPNTVRIEIWHQVLTKPLTTNLVRNIERQNGTIDRDETIRFGKMQIGPGTAFAVGEPNAKLRRNGEIPVAKEWVTIDTLDFLIESVPFIESEEPLRVLPARLEARNINRKRATEAIALARSQSDRLSRLGEPRGVQRSKPVSIASYSDQELRSKSVAQQTSAKNINLAQSTGEVPENKSALGALKGFMVDFPVTLTSDDDFTFKGDTTYWVTGDVELTGRTILEGGAVIKFTNSASFFPKLTISGTFECQTTPYNPAFLTAEDDDTVGEKIASSTGTPTTTNFYSGYNLRFSSSSTSTLSVHDIQTRYSKVGIGFDRPGNNVLWNIIAYQCERGIETTSSGITIRNALINQTQFALDMLTATNKSIVAEHLTVSSAEVLFNAISSNNCSLLITNSLLCSITNSPAVGVSSNYVYAVSGTAFTNVGFGFHYLADGSAYRDAGTTNVTSSMQAILDVTTTDPPSLRTSDFTSNTTLALTAGRDLGIPDVGYHYYPIDYLWGEINVTNATLTVTNGAVLANYGENGTILQSGASFYSTGIPQRLNGIVRYECVQEQGSTSWSASASTKRSLISFETNASPNIQIRFTRAAVPADTQQRRAFVDAIEGDKMVESYLIRDSQFANTYQYYNALSSSTNSGLVLFNNLLFCTYFDLRQTNGGGLYPYPISVHNNYFRKGGINFKYNSTNTAWTFKDNHFYHVAISGTYTGLDAGYNAYRSTGNLGGSNNFSLSSPDFVSGPLGDYYYPSSGTILNSLVNAGSRSAADAGLYHFTTSGTTASKETNSTVDIGFHYAAVDSGGVPVDTDADGLFDFAEDINGNGVFDTGESDWQSYSGSGQEYLPDTGGAINLRIYTPFH